VLQKIEHVCGSVSLDDQGHSPNPRGEDLLRQFYASVGLQYGIQHLEVGLLLTYIIDVARKKMRRACTQNVTKQSLSDYAQQDWPVMTKRSASRHAKASSGKGYISLQQLTLNTFKHVISQFDVISIIGSHPILSMQL
jgi:hypothetical protein